MKNKIEFYKKLPIDEEKGIWKLLCQCDKEFVPRLSSRESSVQKNALEQNEADKETKPYAYFEELKKQMFILIKNETNGRLLGFLSFKHQYRDKELKEYNPSNYATTSCVDKRYRNKGYGRMMYQFLEMNLPYEYQSSFITRRTWSSNHNQIHIFKKLGFHELHKIENHRGEGIHTIYFGKEIKKQR